MSGNFPVSQRTQEQHPDSFWAEWDRTLINIIAHTCFRPTYSVDKSLNSVIFFKTINFVIIFRYDFLAFLQSPWTEAGPTWTPASESCWKKSDSWDRNWLQELEMVAPPPASQSTHCPLSPSEHNSVLIVPQRKVNWHDSRHVCAGYSPPH